jgi:hypothetical protein
VVEEMDRATGRLNKSKAKGKSSERDTTGGGEICIYRHTYTQRERERGEKHGIVQEVHA